MPDISFVQPHPRGHLASEGDGATKLFVGHFENAANPTFVLDSRRDQAFDQRPDARNATAPISSDCTANPFNQDGDACQGGAAGKAFFLFNDGAKGARKIFGDRFK